MEDFIFTYEPSNFA